MLQKFQKLDLFRNSLCRSKTVMLNLFQHLSFRFINERIKLKEAATEIPKQVRDDISGGLMLSFARDLNTITPQPLRGILSHKGRGETKE